eukprot:CAMPEP_0168763010 /NCGR_PEP_ID=MMETSP0724-20121128/24139_1 /TAXON_ID=265536 /ORGANISM="Amphiprora sp., Strain CCMP467" /LENGTH=406 /DNA_ID=CAMNT_0008812193 /DNA_START=393 /DNA_END=1613 /DNA_ORIENTATION=+
MSEDRIRISLEPWMHGTVITIALGTAVVCLSLEMLNDSSLWCWINAAPAGCSQSFESGQPSDCVRGDNAELFRWTFFYGPLWAAIAGTMTTMFMLWRTVRKQEDEAAKWCDRFKDVSDMPSSAGTINSSSKGTSRNTIHQSVKQALGLFALSKKSTSANAQSQETAYTNTTGINSNVGQSQETANANANGVSGTISNVGFSSASTVPNTKKPMNRKSMLQKRAEHSSRRHRKSTLVKHQAFRYVAVFWITWLPGSLNRLLELAGYEVFGIFVAHAIFVPLQGFLNLLVYKYPVYYQWRRKRQKEKEAAEKRKRKVEAALQQQVVELDEERDSQINQSHGTDFRFSGIESHELEFDSHDSYVDDEDLDHSEQEIAVDSTGVGTPTAMPAVEEESDFEHNEEKKLTET